MSEAGKGNRENTEIAECQMIFYDSCFRSSFHARD